MKAGKTVPFPLLHPCCLSTSINLCSFLHSNVVPPFTHISLKPRTPALFLLTRDGAEDESEGKEATRFWGGCGCCCSKYNNVIVTLPLSTKPVSPQEQIFVLPAPPIQRGSTSSQRFLTSPAGLPSSGPKESLLPLGTPGPQAPKALKHLLQLTSLREEEPAPCTLISYSRAPALKLPTQPGGRPPCPWGRTHQF